MTGSDLAYAKLPGWRQPWGAIDGYSCESDPAEQLGLRGAILDLLGSQSLTRDELAARIAEEWGDCSPEQLGAALRELITDGVVQHTDERYRLRGGR